jgi:signal transduction histidine kinase
LDALLRQVDSGAERQDILRTLTGWSYEPASKRLSLIAEQIRALAGRLGKAEVDVTCLPTSLRLPPRKWAPFWSVFAHLVRNSVDHGIETTAERASSAKPLRASLIVSIVEQQQFLTVSIQDDGGGVDYAKVAELARRRGLPADTDRALQEALFMDGVSLRSVVSATSGRGIGLGAVREYVRSLGGDVQVSSRSDIGTTVTCSLPLSMLSDEATFPG